MAFNLVVDTDAIMVSVWHVVVSLGYRNHLTMMAFA